MFSIIKKWLEKYTESKSNSIPKYLGGKKSGAELNNMRREKQAIKVSKLCKFLKPVFVRLPDNKLDRIALLDITKKIENP